jgi:hypothetical protein
MHDVVRVRVGERARDFTQHPHRIGQRNRIAGDEPRPQ